MRLREKHRVIEIRSSNSAQADFRSHETWFSFSQTVVTPLVAFIPDINT